MAGNANSGSKREKLIGDALRVAAKRVHEGDPQGRIKLAVAAAKIVDLACDGDIAAFKEIADRIDGKPHQSMEVETTVRQYVIGAKAERPTPKAWQQQHAPEAPKTIQ